MLKEHIYQNENPELIDMKKDINTSIVNSIMEYKSMYIIQ